MYQQLNADTARDVLNLRRLVSFILKCSQTKYTRSWYSYFHKCHMRDHLISVETTHICLKPIELICLDTQRVNLVQRKYVWNNSQGRNLFPQRPVVYFLGPNQLVCWINDDTVLPILHIHFHIHIGEPIHPLKNYRNIIARS